MLVSGISMGQGIPEKKNHTRESGYPVVDHLHAVLSTGFLLTQE
jgi:hypothetical protein